MGLVQARLLSLAHLVQQHVRQHRLGDARGGLPAAGGQSRIEVSELGPKPCFAHGPNLALVLADAGCATLFTCPASNPLAGRRTPQYPVPGVAAKQYGLGSHLSSSYGHRSSGAWTLVCLARGHVP